MQVKFGVMHRVMHWNETASPGHVVGYAIGANRGTELKDRTTGGPPVHALLRARIVQRRDRGDTGNGREDVPVPPAWT